MAEALDFAEGIRDQIVSWASQQMSAAANAISSLGNAAYPYTAFGSMDAPNVTVSLQTPPPPESFSDPSPPADVSVAIPTFPPAPSISIPSVPSLSSVSIPSAPGISTPSMASISPPAMLGLSIPAAPSITLDDFTIEPPEELTLEPTDYVFTLEEITAGGVLNDEIYLAVKNRVVNNITYGGTGLLPEIEDAIWDRELERENQALQDAIDKTITMWSKTGFSLPDGMVAHSLSELQKDFQNRKIDRAREIAIKQADLEQVNLFKSMEIGTALWAKLNELLIDIQKLALLKQENTIKYFNEYLRLQVEIHNNSIEVFKARVSAYEAQLRAKLGQVDIYKAQIEAEMAKAGINEANARIYSTQITAEVAKVNAASETNRNIVQIFSEQVRAALAQAQINESQIRAYAEQVRGAVAQAEIYNALCNATASIAKISVANAGVNAEKARAYTAQVSANAEKYKASIEHFRASGAYNIAAAELSQNTQKINADLLSVTRQINQAYKELGVKSMNASADAKMESLRAIAQLTTSMASGLASALHAAGEVRYDESKKLKAET